MQARIPSRKESQDNPDYYHNIFQLSYEPAFVAAANGSIIDANIAACDLALYSYEELLTTSLSDLFQLEMPGSVHQALQKELRSGRRIFSGYSIRKDGTLIPVEIQADNAAFKGKPCMIIIVRNLTANIETAKVVSKNKYFQSLHETTLDLLNQLDINIVLKSIVTRACDLFRTPHGYVCFANESENTLEVIIGLGHYTDLIGYKFHSGRGITGLAAKKGEPVVVENYQAWPGKLKDDYWGVLQTGTGIPLKAFGKTIGVIGVDFFDLPRPFSNEEVDILARYAELASVALVNATLHSNLAQSENLLKEKIESARYQNEFLSSLHETAIGLLNNLDLEEVLQNILNHACELFNTKETYLYKLDDAGENLILKCSTGNMLNYSDYSIKVGTGVSGKAVASDQPVLVHDYQNWPDRLLDSCCDNLKTAIAIPVSANGKPIGVIGLNYFDQQQSFTEEHIQMFGRFAELASIALANAKLHSNLASSEKLLQQKNEELTTAHEELMASEEELRQQFNELMTNEEAIHRQNIVLTSLHHTALSLMHRSNLDDLLNLIVANTAELFGTPHVWIEMVDDSRIEFTNKFSTGIFAQFVNTKTKVTEGLVGQGFSSGQIITLDDYSTWEHRLENPEYDKIRAAIQVPLKTNDEVVGVLGLAFLSPARKISASDISLMASFAELVSIALDNAFLISSYQKEIDNNRKTEEALRKSEQNYRTIFDATDDSTYLYDADTFEILYINAKASEIYGFTRAEVVDRSLTGQGTGPMPYSEEQSRERLKKAAAGEPQIFEWIVQTRDGDLIWEEVHAKKVLIGSRECILEVSRDISERKKNELELRKSEASNKALINAIPDPMLILKSTGVLIDYKGSKERLRFLPDRFIGKNIADLLPPEVAAKLLQNIKITIESGEIQIFEFELPAVKITYYEARIVSSGDDEVLAIIRDITDRKSMEIQLKHLSLHDSLTGLYNRAYFEEGMKRLEGARNGSAGLMICDVDGLKIINDTLGHNIGDIILKAVAAILKNCFRPGDLVARIGGDEFAVLLPHNSLQAFEAESNKIKRKIEIHNAENPTYPISLSIGFAISTETPIDINSLFKEADNNMYREKLHRHKSGRSAIVQALMKALEERDFITEGHGDRLQGLIVSFANAIGLPERELADLRLLAKFHDIGKVGIPDNILFKPGKLSEEEFSVMRQHCEIGYRIAKSAPDLVPIADWVLKHQEWWNGKGYPLGLSGEDIPLACRMLSIVDSFDAMTSDRPYRKAISSKDAIDEILRCAGTQFDPKLVNSFITLIKTR